MIGRLCVISQPRYLPVISYLQRLHFADCFILLDVVQRQGRGWENRNKLLLPEPRWLTIPISSSSRALIKNASINGSEWLEQHINIIHHHYCRHPHFDMSVIEKYYEGIDNMMRAGQFGFTDIIERMLLNLGDMFHLNINLKRASSFETATIRDAKGPAKLRAICNEAKCQVYVSGGNGRAYGVEEAFRGSGIKVLFHKPQEPPYKQPGQSKFVPYMAFFDAVFCLGLDVVREWIVKPPILEE